MDKQIKQIRIDELNQYIKNAYKQIKILLNALKQIENENISEDFKKAAINYFIQDIAMLKSKINKSKRVLKQMKGE